MATDCEGRSVTMECSDKKCISIVFCTKKFGISKDVLAAESAISKWKEEVGEEVPPGFGSCCFGRN